MNLCLLFAYLQEGTTIQPQPPRRLRTAMKCFQDPSFSQELLAVIRSILMLRTQIGSILLPTVGTQRQVCPTDGPEGKRGGQQGMPAHGSHPTKKL